MRAGLLTVTLHLPGVRSLKEKRSIVKPLIAQITALGPAIGVAEVADHDELDRVTLRIVHVSNDVRRSESVLGKIEGRLARGPRFALEESEREIL
ncbi:MAG: DUF503 domain-containing protein [Candidatus Bipolaricaulota bacterium]|nr:MAG: DUF503 domain-containing protein [Candidatus Bipolaricaulota bacterium]